MSVCRNPKIVREILRSAPDSVIKAICNVALNALKGDVKLSASQKLLFKKHKRAILTLADRKKPLLQKRKVVQQSGGFWIPALVGGILALLGSKVLTGNN